MPESPSRRHIKAGITARGFITAVKDYTEPAVVEELAANSFDADATTVAVILDSENQRLHVIDDGTGFSRQSIENAAVLGGGDKREVEFSMSKRPYLGAYGFGLKSSIRIANTVVIRSVSRDGSFGLTIDWKHLEEALRAEGDGFELVEQTTPRGSSRGTHIVLELKNPTKDLLDAYHRVLANLPDASGKCRYYTAFWQNVKSEMAPVLKDFAKLRSTCTGLMRRRLMKAVTPSDDPDLRQCEHKEWRDKEDGDVKCDVYFAGYDRDDAIKPLKKGLRGIYVRIQGRLLKQSFDEQKYVYGISKWVKFAAGLRVELSIDWLRNEISLSRDGLTFSNKKLEEQFRATLQRNIGAFIAPQLKMLSKKAERHQTRRQSQRIELAKSRSRDGRVGKIKEIRYGFAFRPETDGELALLIANEDVLRRVSPDYRLLDYNDQAPFDCILYDEARRDLVFCELEPTLMEFLQHKNAPEELTLIITWSLGKWRMGSRKRGVSASFELTEPSRKLKGHYTLLQYPRENSKKPTRNFEVVALDELLTITS